MKKNTKVGRNNSFSLHEKTHLIFHVKILFLDFSCIICILFHFTFTSVLDSLILLTCKITKILLLWLTFSKNITSCFFALLELLESSYSFHIWLLSSHIHRDTRETFSIWKDISPHLMIEPVLSLLMDDVTRSMISIVQHIWEEISVFFSLEHWRWVVESLGWWWCDATTLLPPPLSLSCIK